MALEGGCRCGASRYTLEHGALPVTYTCHCLDCQTMSGAAFTMQAPVLLERLSVEGETLDWAHPNSRGQVTTQLFCATCKTRLFSTNEGRPNIALLRAGTLDRSGELEPAVHMWVKRKQPWVGLPADSETYTEAVPADRLMALLVPNLS